MLVVLRLSSLGLTPTPARLASLAAACLTVFLTARLLHRGTGRIMPGMRPLLAVSLLISLVLFVVLANHLPHVRLIAHFILSWLAGLAFAGLGTLRLRKRDNRDR